MSRDMESLASALRDTMLRHPEYGMIRIYFPDFCPRCREHGEQVHTAYHYDWNLKKDTLHAVFRCPRHHCHKPYIAEYVFRLGKFKSHERSWILDWLGPLQFAPQQFPSVISKLSPLFCEIYNQAKRAEEGKLDQIAGRGYRKALEFLVKDYLKRRHANRAEEIEGKLLAACIADLVMNENVKHCAKRATWLGNDETHYVRKWPEKDVHDLKELIELTVAWIVTELKTEALLASMPDIKATCGAVNAKP